MAQNGLNKINDMMSLAKTSLFQCQSKPRDLEINQQGYPFILGVPPSNICIVDLDQVLNIYICIITLKIVALTPLSKLVSPLPLPRQA